VLLGKDGKLAGGQSPVALKRLRCGKGPARTAPPLILDWRHDALVSPIDLRRNIKQIGTICFPSLPLWWEGRGDGLVVAQQLPDLAFGSVGEMIDPLLPGIGGIRVVPLHLGQASLKESLASDEFLLGWEGTSELGHVMLESVALELVPGGLGMGDCEKRQEQTQEQSRPTREERPVGPHYLKLCEETKRKTKPWEVCRVEGWGAKKLMQERFIRKLYIPSYEASILLWSQEDSSKTPSDSLPI